MLASERALAVERAHALGRDAAEVDRAQGPDGHGADDRLGADPLAAGELDRAAGADVDAPHGRLVPDPRAERVGERRDEATAAAREPQALPGGGIGHRVAVAGRRGAELPEQREPFDRARAGRARRELREPVRAAGGALATQEVADRQAVEPLRVRVRPRVGRVDLPGQAEQLRVGAGGAGPVGRGEPRVAEDDAVDEVVRLDARLGDVARDELEPELRGEREVVAVDLADELAAELDGAPARELLPLHPAAGPVARLHDEHVRARRREIARAGEAREPRAGDDDVVRAHATRSSSARTSPAARRPLRSAPSIRACHSPAVCSPANASGPTGRASASSARGEASDRAE